MDKFVAGFMACVLVVGSLALYAASEAYTSHMRAEAWQRHTGEEISAWDAYLLRWEIHKHRGIAMVESSTQSDAPADSGD